MSQRDPCTVSGYETEVTWHGNNETARMKCEELVTRMGAYTLDVFAALNTCSLHDRRSSRPHLQLLISRRPHCYTLVAWLCTLTRLLILAAPGTTAASSGIGLGPQIAVSLSLTERLPSPSQHGLRRSVASSQTIPGVYDPVLVLHVVLPQGWEKRDDPYWYLSTLVPFLDASVGITMFSMGVVLVRSPTICPQNHLLSLPSLLTLPALLIHHARAARAAQHDRAPEDIVHKFLSRVRNGTGWEKHKLLFVPADINNSEGPPDHKRGQDAPSTSHGPLMPAWADQQVECAIFLEMFVDGDRFL
ncbi:hypothetical protein BD311DRAFT_742819 [Dichomitus squalens]|uniref:Uncharacterized protein n=1 Tax=Dichomitus squalens TaxID=114155 RepID=A0A4Q9M780_9APHY|nr:hypothetical protein BD311DRAFT_742819 [Dichomitus squalens]